MTDKQVQDNLQPVNFRMTPDELAHLDKIATYCGLSRSQLLRNIVTGSMEEFDMFKKIGVMRAMLTVRDVMDIITGKCPIDSENVDSQGKSEA